MASKQSALADITGINLDPADTLPVLDKSDTTMAGTGTNKEVTRAEWFYNVPAIESDVSTIATSGSTETLDTSLFAIHDVTMDQACTFTFSNPAPSGNNTTFMLILRGAFTPTFPGSVDWADATPPTYTTPSVYIFTTVDAGTVWLGQSVGKAFG